MTDLRFFRFGLGHLIVLTMVIGVFFSGRRTMHTKLIRLEDRVYVAERNHEQARESLRRQGDKLEESDQLVNHARRRIVDILATGPTFEVVQVTDGATIRVSMEKTRTVRLKGIDCPEVGQPLGNQAKVCTSSYCRNPVWLVQQEPNSQGDIIAVVISSRGDIINDGLVRFGLARPDEEHKNELGWLETAAQKMKRGMWAE